MSTAIVKPDTSSCIAHTDVYSHELPFSMDCSPFLNWEESNDDVTPHEKGVVFESLVATLKLRSSLDVALEAKAVNFLESVDPRSSAPADAFLNNFASNSDESLTNFVQSVLVLISSPSQIIITAEMKMVEGLIVNCSLQVYLALVKANIIPEIINTLNPHSLSFAEAVDTHTFLITSLTTSVWLAAPSSLAELGIRGHDGRQAVYEAVLQQVLIPSEKYILHLCVNRYSIVDGQLSRYFLDILTNLLQMSPSYQPTMDFVLHMPVVLTIPSYFKFLEINDSIWYFLYGMNVIHQKWNEQCGEVPQMGKTVHRMLRMEGIEDIIGEKLQTDQNGFSGRMIIAYSITRNNLLGRNLPEHE